jgi:FkbM family methyltransferase
VARELISKSGGDPAKYYLIEGCPENFEKLKAGCPDCKLFPQVVSDTDGEVEFFVGHHPAIEGSSQSNSLIRDFIATKDWNKETTTHKVRSSTLDGFYRDNELSHVRLLKINCEGGEYKILCEPDSTFDFVDKTDFLYLQLHGKSAMFTSPEFMQKKRDIIEKLKGLGFEVVISDDLVNMGKGHIHILFERKQ